MYELFVRTSFWQLLLRTCNKKNAAKTTFIQKICMYNVDKIDYRTHTVSVFLQPPIIALFFENTGFKYVLHDKVRCCGKLHEFRLFALP